MQATESLIASRRFRFTRRQFEELCGTDALRDQRVELVEGQVVFMGQQGPPHADAIELLTAWLAPELARLARFRVQLPFAVDDETLLVPDLALVSPGHPRGEHPSSALLVIEVSDSSARYDRLVKAPLYAKTGVGEYWLIDLQKEHLEVLSAPGPTGYGSHHRFTRGRVAVPGFPGVALEVEDLFR